MTPVEQYIRQAALARNIDPDTAVTVAKHEGGLSDPFRRAGGPAPKSQLGDYGATENSYGPFQLYISGTGAGLGDRAIHEGIDPRRDWQAGVDYALDEVSKKGWGQWYGAKAAGITGMIGIGGNPTGGATPSETSPTQMADAQPQSPAADSSPATPPSVIQALISGKSDKDGGGKRGGLLAALSQLDSGSPRIAPVNFGSNNTDPDALGKYVSAYTQNALKKNPFQTNPSFLA